MRRLAWTVATVAVTVFLAGLGVFAAFGAFETSEDLDRHAEHLDGGVLEDDMVAADAATPDGGGIGLLTGTHSLPLGGKATVVLKHFALDDRQGRQVLRVRRIESVLDLDAIKRGVYRVTEGTIEDPHVTLYRDHTGRISLAHVEGRMVKPNPLPKPVRIVYAEGVVRPSGHPLVSLTARTCLGAMSCGCTRSCRHERRQSSSRSTPLGSWRHWDRWGSRSPADMRPTSFDTNRAPFASTTAQSAPSRTLATPSLSRLSPNSPPHQNRPA